MIDMIRNVIEDGESTLQLNVDGKFKNFLAVFLTEACAGMMIDFIPYKNKYDTEGVIQNILLICRVSVPNILKAQAEKETKEKNI